MDNGKQQNQHRLNGELAKKGQEEALKAREINHDSAKPRWLQEEHPPLTVTSLRGIVPASVKQSITQEVVDEINGLIDDPDVRGVFRENLFGFSRAMEEPMVGIHNYINAVKYVSYKMLGYSNQDAWIRTFPKRYQRLCDKAEKEMGQIDMARLASLTYNFNQGKAVTAVMKQSFIPVWLMNRDLYQKAVNVQAELMATAKSEKVRSDAANSLLTHLKPPEVNEMNLNVKVEEDDSIKELREATLDLVNKQRQMIDAKVIDAEEAARQKIVPMLEDS